MTIIIKPISCSMILSGKEPVPGTMVLGWVSDYPPLVRIDFHHPDTPDDPSRWEVSRDTLVECMRGDQGVDYGGEEFAIQRGEVSGMISLSTTHTAAITFLLEPLIEFLMETLTYVPRGDQESVILQEQLEAWLEEIPNG